MMCNLIKIHTDTYTHMCFLPVHSGHQVRWTYQSGFTQEEGRTGFLIHLVSAVRAFIFLARRIQPFLSLVDREVKFCVLTINRSPPVGHFYLGNGQKRELPVLFGQKWMYPKTIAAESVLLAVSDWPTPTISRFWPKSDRVLPIIATLLSFHPFLAILCFFPVGYSTARTDQHMHRPQEQVHFQLLIPPKRFDIFSP